MSVCDLKEEEQEKPFHLYHDKAPLNMFGKTVMPGIVYKLTSFHTIEDEHLIAHPAVVIVGQ